MTSHRPPRWLESFQARFGVVLRTPLDRSSGTLRATPSAYDPSVDAVDGPRARAGERLAVYNRQYWFRLFTVIQIAFPLTTRLLGHWAFNDYAARFLLSNPPRGWDIDHVPDGFEVWFAAALDHPDIASGRSGQPVARDALIEAVRIDAAWRRVFRAPSTMPYRPSAEDAAWLLESRLVPSPAVAVIEEHWALLELRRTTLGDDGDAPVPLPTRLACSRWWALVRRAEGVGQLALDAREAELFSLLERYTVQEALARLEAACSEAERVDLPGRAQSWLARSVELDFWIGMKAADAG